MEFSILPPKPAFVVHFFLHTGCSAVFIKSNEYTSERQLFINAIMPCCFIIQIQLVNEISSDAHKLRDEFVRRNYCLVLHFHDEATPQFLIQNFRIFNDSCLAESFFSSQRRFRYVCVCPSPTRALLHIWAFSICIHNGV